jgi:deazaflavin-dependent oxidoreductase (nitroreductase family)
MTAPSSHRRKARVPPRWFVVGFWHGHRALLRLTGGRFGLWRPKPGKWGTLRLTTTGRRSGERRQVVVGYFEDGPDLVTMAMNGWDEGDPSWWRNLEAHPDAVVKLSHQRPRPVRARRAVGEERERLWQRWATVDQDLDRYAAMRTNDTPIVVFEPRDVSS